MQVPTTNYIIILLILEKLKILYIKTFRNILYFIKKLILVKISIKLKLKVVISIKLIVVTLKVVVLIKANIFSTRYILNLYLT